MGILQQPAWCSACARFVVAEEVPSVEYLAAEIARYRSGNPDTLQTWALISGGEPIEAEVANLSRRLQ